MRYLYIEEQEEDDPLKIDTVQNLQILSGITFNQWIRNNSSKLTCLEKLKIEGRCELVEEVEFSNSIAKIHSSLKSLYLKASDESSIPSLAMSSCPHLCKLDIKGRMQKLTETFQFPRNLSQLTLEECRLECDPMPILEKLPNLLTLRLRAGSYLGKEMHVSANGFPRLQILQLLRLKELVWLNILKGAMPWLIQLGFDNFKTEIFGLNELLNLVEVKIPFSLLLAMILFHKIEDSFWGLTRIAGAEGGMHICRQKGLTLASSKQALEQLADFLEQCSRLNFV